MLCVSSMYALSVICSMCSVYALCKLYVCSVCACFMCALCMLYVSCMCALYMLYVCSGVLFVCSMYVLCKIYVCSVYALCMFYVCSVDALCIFCVCSMYILCMLYASYAYDLRMFYVSSMCALCMMYARFMYAICMLYVCSMCAMCMLHAYILYASAKPLKVLCLFNLPLQSPTHGSISIKSRPHISDVIPALFKMRLLSRSPFPQGLEQSDHSDHWLVAHFSISVTVHKIQNQHTKMHGTALFQICSFLCLSAQFGGRSWQQTACRLGCRLGDTTRS